MHGIYVCAYIVYIFMYPCTYDIYHPLHKQFLTETLYSGIVYSSHVREHLFFQTYLSYNLNIAFPWEQFTGIYCC